MFDCQLPHRLISQGRVVVGCSGLFRSPVVED
jgi:hypothetical protein